MFYYDVNILAVILSGVLSMAVGFLWYGPKLFGGPWVREMGLTPEKLDEMKKKKNMGATYGLSFLTSLFTAYALGVVITTLGSDTVAAAVEAAVLLWVGFIAPIKFTDVLFGAKSRTLFAIDAGYQLSSVVVMAVTLFLWQ